MSEQGKQQIMIDASHACIRYTGRNDLSEPGRALLLYAGNSVRVRFGGPSLSVRMSMPYGGTSPMWIGIILDGGEMISIRLHPGDEIHDYMVAEGLSEGMHEMILVRKNDFVSGHCAFHGILIEAGCGVAEPAPTSARRIECFGDSITAGSHSDAAGYEGKEDPVDEEAALGNAWNTYGAILSRMVGAELHNNGLGGLALMDGFGYTCTPNPIGLLTTFDKLNPIPGKGGYTPWDFSRYTPHIVVVAIGQNDSSTYPDPLAHPEAGEKWIEAYLQLLRQLRAVYPNAYFILTTTLMFHPPVWDDLLFTIAKRFGDPRVAAYRYKRAGTGSPGHLRKAEAEEMAAEMAAFIDTLEDPWQERQPGICG